MKDKNRFVAILLIFIVSLCAVLSAIFSGILLAKSENNSNTAYADEINFYFDYTTSNLILCGSAFRLDRLVEDIPSNYSGRFYSSNYATGGVRRYLPMSISFVITWNEGVELTVFENKIGCFSRNGFRYFDCNIYDHNGGTVSEMIPHQDSMPNYNPDTFDFFDTFYESVYILSSPGFDDGSYSYGGFQVASFYTGNISLDKLLYVDIFSKSRYVHTGNANTNHTEVCTVLDYFDSNSVHFVIVLYASYYGTDGTDYDISSLPFMIKRRYYLPYSLNDALDTADLLSRQYFDQGYSEGKSEGYNLGLVEGFDSGHASGYSEGEARGKIIGASEANEYSFFSLISAVVDAPIQAFTGLLNFNILGFNLLGFITGLLTLGLIIWIVSIVLGKK